MYIDRPIFHTLFEHRMNRKITILLGARQVGKTSLLQALYKTLQAEETCLFLDLDLYSNYEKVSTYENLMNTLRLNGYQEDQSRTFFLFLDEFQRYADVTLLLKNIVDHHPNVKVYASGSSSLVIRSKIQESLAGRKRIVFIHPLSFSEYLRFREKTEAIEKLHHLGSVRSKSLNQLVPEIYRELEDFMIYGGYPEVALAKVQDRPEIYSGIFDLYVKKELVDYLKVEKIRNAKLLIKTLAVNHGCETNYAELAQLSSLDEKTVKGYIEILKETFLVTVLSPWFTNRNREIVKMPKVYFSDSGVRNYFINSFNPLSIRKDAAWLFEGYVITELIKNGADPSTLKFWRTKNQMEVDLILDHGPKPIPVEIKYKQKITGKDVRGLKSFITQYPDTDKSYLANLNDNQTIFKNMNCKLVSPFALDELLRTDFDS
jgi:predicted AAA+ superfamily ATPase